MLTVAIIGLGNRGRKYAYHFTSLGAKVTAVCDVNKGMLEYIRKKYDIPENMAFDNEDDFFRAGKLADALVISTQDRDHYRHAVKGMDLNYHLLCEKPVSPVLEQCEELERMSREKGLKMVVCHVLRYSPFFRKIRELIGSGAFGRVVTINHTENVGYWHFAHSFVRGNWRNESESTFMLLAKCCHDLDILVYLIGADCSSVSSMGALSWFYPGNPEKGADFCFECGKKDCPYNAEKFYLANPLWVKVPALPQAGREEFIRNWINRRENPYARCVYACDNDVVDHQIVDMQFENGATAHLTLTAFTKDFYRNVKVCMEKGVIEGDMRDKTLRVCHFGQEEEIVDLSGSFSDAHGGGDARLIDDVCEIMEGRKAFSETSVSASMQSHKIAFAAEESRKSGGELKKV